MAKPQAPSVASGNGGGPNDDGPVQIWRNVPDRFILELSVDSTDKEFGATASFVSEDGRVDPRWRDAEIHPGPKRRLLSQTAMGYSVVVLVAFDSKESISAEIRAKIVAPDGTVFGGSYFHAVTGKRGEIQPTNLFIEMVPA